MSHVAQCQVLMVSVLVAALMVQAGVNYLTVIALSFLALPAACWTGFRRHDILWHDFLVIVSYH